jgi:hypothetical protein
VSRSIFSPDGAVIDQLIICADIARLLLSRVTPDVVLLVLGHRKVGDVHHMLRDLSFHGDSTDALHQALGGQSFNSWLGDVHSRQVVVCAVFVLFHASPAFGGCSNRRNS